jgi:hypothetical protein
MTKQTRINQSMDAPKLANLSEYETFVNSLVKETRHNAWKAANALPVPIDCSCNVPLRYELVIDAFILRVTITSNGSVRRQWFADDNKTKLESSQVADRLSYLHSTSPNADRHFETAEQYTARMQPEEFQAVADDALTAYKAEQTFDVIVGNIGTVYSGNDSMEANRIFDVYKQLSKDGYGRAAFEPVTLMRNNEPWIEHEGCSPLADSSY